MDRLLKVFITVVEQKNLTRAAEILYITQSAVSQNIKLLEEQFNTTLINRTNKSMTLTKAGDILYNQAKIIIDQYSLTERMIEDLQKGVSGPLNIGSGFTYGEYLLPKVISTFIKEYPDIIPKITIKNSARIAKQVKQRDLDIGIIEKEIYDSQLVTIPFAKDKMVIIVPADFPKKNGEQISLNELEDKTWIIRESGSGTRVVGDNMFTRTKLAPKNVLEFGSTQLIKEIVKNGIGISYISEVSVKDEIKQGTIKALTIKEYQDSRTFYYVTNKSHASTKALRTLIDTIEIMNK